MLLDKRSFLLGAGLASMLGIGLFTGLYMASPLKVTVNGQEVYINRIWFNKHKVIKHPINKWGL